MHPCNSVALGNQKRYNEHQLGNFGLSVAALDLYEGLNMPIISMFYGIIIRMYVIDNLHHALPHLHARYAEFEASIGIEEGEILAGNLPRKQLRLVQA